MDRTLLNKIDEGLESTEVEELCFLCSDIVKRRQLEDIKFARDLFLKLEEKDFLNSAFLAELLRTIQREDLFNQLKSDSSEREETDASPAYLSEYRLMLYKLHMDLTNIYVEKMKFLLGDHIAKRQLDTCKTALNVFAEMEKAGMITKNNVDKLHKLMIDIENKPLEHTVKGFKDRLPPTGAEGGVNNHNGQQAKAPPEDTDEFYSLTQDPRGLCVIINNEDFKGPKYKKRLGSKKDNENLSNLFKRFGFVPEIHEDLTADKITETLKELCKRDFSKDDALVVCLLSHGEKGAIIGIDEKDVMLEQIFESFKNVSTLFGKPKLFFIQACQQEVSQRTNREEPSKETPSNSVYSDASRPSTDGDILIGMATVPNSIAFRHTENGSIYIQVLCQELKNAAESPRREMTYTVLTHVNRKVHSHFQIPSRQMPEPKYTLTKRLVLRFV
ncbi:caspase-8-like isoform X2 [Gambusia affinis]|uniref:caspase-8-like isoform X2 n=1 Tax=Gambusia affinis TaxID=33528 RepID=UPI001CDB4925|nr:caspase-8-like isoform X2 [Gambusia affinis]